MFDTVKLRTARVLWSFYLESGHNLQQAKNHFLDNFYRAMHMHKRGICCHAMSVTFVSCVKTNKDIFEIFHHRVAKPFEFFRAKRDGDISMETPLTGASNAGVVGKKRDSGRVSGFAAYR